MFAITGKLHEAKGVYKEALKAYGEALAIDSEHVPSLICSAVVLRQCSDGDESNAVTRSLLMEALRRDRLNGCAWYNLGLLHKAEATPSSLMEAADCFEAAHFLQETSPVEPFR